MNINTGADISEINHLKQSISNILTTPIGSRVMRRDYGSRLFELLDRPMSPELIADIQAAVVMAITANEPRLQLTRVEVKAAGTDEDGNRKSLEKGRLVVNLDGIISSEGRHVRMENIAL